MPKNQNRKQRQGFVASLFLSIIILFFHFPFDGYYVEHLVVTRYGEGKCPTVTLDDLQKMTIDDLAKSTESMKKCSNEEEMQLLPFTEWRSVSPIIYWCGSVVNTISAIFTTLLLGVLWIWTYRDTEIKNN